MNRSPAQNKREAIVDKELRNSSRKTTGVRMAFVHLAGLCWAFFQYHLLIKAKETGVEFIDRPVSTVEEQIAEIEKLILEDTDVILVRPMATDDSKLIATLQMAQKSGIHLISIDGMPGGAIDMCSVTADNFGGQAALAEYAFLRMQGKGKVAYFQGDQRTEAGLLRSKGLQSVLGRFPGIDLVFTAAFDWSSTTFNFLQGLEMARAALTAHPDLDAIISATDEGALGVTVVLEELGLRGKVMVTGFDGMPEGITALSAGDMEATARQPLDAMAQQAFELALGLASGKVGTITHTVHDVDLVTRDNIGATALRLLRIFPQVTEDLNERVTEQKNSAAFLEALLDNMPTMLIVKEAKDLRYIRVNKAREAWLNTPHGSQLGKNAYDFYPAETAERYHAADRAILQAGKPVDVLEEKVDPKGQGIRYTQTRKVPILDATGKPDYLMIISEDITEQTLAEQALARHTAELEKTNRALTKNYEKLVQAEKLAALGALVAGVAHELNTPIGNALMAVTTLADHTKRLRDRCGVGLTRSMLETYLSDARKGIEIMERNLRRSAELIQSFKQIAIDQTSSQARAFSLATLVAETLLALSPTLKKTPFVIRQDIPPDLYMDSFPGPLEQVLMNLVNNAVIHGLGGRSEGTITLAARIAKPGWVEIVVQDDGVGIREESISRIYDPFFSTKFGSGGSGLGLSISNNIVTHLLGGSIDVSSAPGLGTRFSLLLPLEARGSHD